MEHITSLIETVLWVGLIVWLVLRFQPHIEAVVTSIQKRIDSGSTIKAGPFTVEEFRPQPIEDQKKKAKEEIQEAIGHEIETTNTEARQKVTDALLSVYMRAEDLALRAIQSDYGATINRQVTAGRDTGFDATFVKDGRLHIVEVKYIQDISNIVRIRASIERLANSIESYHWKNAEIILAVVMANSMDIHEADKKFVQVLEGIQVPVKIRPFYLGELETRFGIEN